MDSGIAFAVGGAGLWGLVYALSQKILGKISPLASMFLTAVISVLIMIPVIALDGSGIDSIRSMDMHTLGLVVLAVVSSVTASYLVNRSIQTSSASMAAFVESTYPFFVVIFCYLIFGQTVNSYFVLGSVLIFLGVLVISQSSEDTVNQPPAPADNGHEPTG